MIIAIVLIVLILGSVIFHFVSPWHALPLASNWGKMDETLAITFAITGIFFVVLNLLLVYILVRFSRKGAKPQETVAFQPVNHKLEKWLTIVTSVGIAALLAPGLSVYADYVTPPKEATQVEVMGTQWQWRYRLPGADGKLGKVDARFVTAANPFGMDAADPDGQDDTMVDGNELHLPIGKPVKMELRALDVLHDYYVPPMRARLNMVPGQVTSFWFTPTVEGKYEAMCAQLCGVGHANMRGWMVVESPEKYAEWLKTRPTFAQSQKPPEPVVAADGAAGAADPVALGAALAKAKACVACHSVDGAAGVGPTWKGLYGKTENFADGSKSVMDEALLKREITEPTAHVVQGFAPIMPKSELTEAEVASLIAYIRAQK